MLVWLLATAVVLIVAGIAAACALQARDTRERPRLDAETREILDDWTED